MSSLTVTLDANVLLPAAVRDTLLRGHAVGLYRAQWSDDILEEVRRNLVRRHLANEAQANHLIDTIKETFPEALVNGYRPLIPSMTNHHEDRHVLAAAVRGQAKLIVTRNVRHFSRESLAQFEIETQTPDEFLLNLLGLGHNAMIQVIVEQARVLRNPPKTVYQVLDGLALLVPNFAASVTDLLRRSSQEGDAVPLAASASAPTRRLPASRQVGRKPRA